MKKSKIIASRTKHFYISNMNFMLDYTQYECDEFTGRYYFLAPSISMTSQVGKEGGLVRRRISKANYERALAECKSVLDETIIEDSTEPFVPAISTDDMISDFDQELREQIADPHYKVNPETAKHELYGFKVALKELSLIIEQDCYVMPDHFNDCTNSKQAVKFPCIGETLPNGYTVQAAYCVGHDRYVLAHRGTAPDPYAVWSVDQDGDTRNGHYFSDPVAAQKQFAFLCFDWDYIANNPCKEAENPYKIPTNIEMKHIIQRWYESRTDMSIAEMDYFLERIFKKFHRYYSVV